MSTSRTLDGEGLDESFAEIDRVLKPVHDIALAAFQRMIDQVAGHACPLREGNTKLVDAIMLRVDRFGLGLYLEGNGEMHRVRLATEGVSPARRSRGKEAANAAGGFRVILVTEPGEPSIARSRPDSVPAFIRRDALPILIVARSREEAGLILRARRLNALDSAVQPATIVGRQDAEPRDQVPG